MSNAASEAVPENGPGSLKSAGSTSRYISLPRQIRNFCIVAIICTATSMTMFAALRPSLGVQWANLVSLVLCSVLNTDLNRRMSFGISEHKLWWRDQGRGLWVMLLALGLTSGSLWVLHVVQPHPSVVTELVVITIANIAAAVSRFLMLRYWIFRRVRQQRRVAA